MLSNTLARGSLHGDAPFKPPAPSCTFAEHHAEIVELLVDGEHVVSLDSARVAFVWNPRTAAVISRQELPANAIANSIFTTDKGPAYFTAEADAVVVHALVDHAVLMRVATTGLPPIKLAVATADLSRVLVASDEEVFLLSPGDGKRLAKASVSSPNWSPEVLSLHVRDGVFIVRYFHVGMDMYPTNDEKRFSVGSLEEVWRPHTFVDPKMPVSSIDTERVELAGRVARVLLAGERPLPDLVAHTQPICIAEWITADKALLTADTSGTIHRWDVDFAPPQLGSSQHAQPITAVRFTKHGVASFTANDTKLWRDGKLVATLPAVAVPIVDEDSLIDASPAVKTYSLLDGGSRSHPLSFDATKYYRSGRGVTWTVGTRGMSRVGLATCFPNHIVSVRDDVERTLPLALEGILSSSAPPIAHAGRVLLQQHLAPARLVALDSLAVVVERELHEGGTCWTALHPDGVTLFSAGYTDGTVARWDFAKLTERDRWTVLDGTDSDRAISRAVLLPNQGKIIVAGWKALRRFAYEDGRLARMLHKPVECALPQHVEELVVDAAEERVVVFFTDWTARVVDVDSMTWVDARAGEVEAALERCRPRSVRGYDNAWPSRDGQWLVGWSRGVGVIPESLTDRQLRAPLLTRLVRDLDAIRATVVDDVRAELWILTKDGSLLRASLLGDTPVEPVAKIAGGETLALVAPSMIAAQDKAGSVHYYRAGGEHVCTIERFVPDGYAKLAESAAVCALRDGSLRAAAIPGDSYVTLSDPRAKLAATALAIAAPFVASRHGNVVLRWDLRTNACTGAWPAPTTLAAIDVRADGAVLAGEANGTVTIVV